LLENVVSFVLESAEHGHSVFRLFHQAVTDCLREGLDSRSVQSAFVAALMTSVPRLAGSDRPNWELANRYIRSHLAAHASAAGELDALCPSSEYLRQKAA
jgi:hypothetical protein